MLALASEPETDAPDAALARLNEVRLNEARAEAVRDLWTATETWRSFIGMGDMAGLYRAFGKMRAAEALAHAAEDAIYDWRQVRSGRSQEREERREGEGEGEGGIAA